MTRLEITPELRGDLGELYFKHLCMQRGYAFIKLEAIYNTLTPQGRLIFKYQFYRVNIQIPDSIVDEVRRVCRPTDLNASDAFVFDFLTCKLGKEFMLGNEVNIRGASTFSWVEVKSGASKLSKHQEEIARTCKIKFNVFRVKDVMDSPDNIWIKWEG